MSESETNSNKPQPKPKRIFTEEFKREAVRLAIERGNIRAVARDLNLHETILSRWKYSIESEATSTISSSSDSENRSLSTFPGQGNPRDEEMVKLQRENARLREDNEILKKAVGIFTKGAR